MKKLFLAFCAISLSFASCNKDDVEVLYEVAPVITLDSDTGVYTVKSNKELTISPTYENVENALYVWTIDGKVVGEDPQFVFSQEECGEVFVQLNVSTRYGSSKEELRIDVIDLELPTISLAGADQGYVILVNSELLLTPSVPEASIPTSYSWTVNGEEVSTEKDLTFQKSVAGTYTLRFEAKNDDGVDSVEFEVKVCSAQEMPFSWEFPVTEFNLSTGRQIRLMPFSIVNPFDAIYTWTLNDRQVQKGNEAAYVFGETAQGSYKVKVTMKNSAVEMSQDLTVNVCPAEGTYRRPKSSASQATWNKVYEFVAAPGQFVNEGYTANTMTEAVAFAEERMKSNNYVSLGGFGGYIVVGFDHSVENSGDYDLEIKGNPFSGSSEPGVVWVMQDENGDGLPNDTWYELKGSEFGKSTTIADYEVTYYRPSAAQMDVQWTDNLGNSGKIDYLGQFHRQDYYYPQWVEADHYTLRGTRLGAQNSDIGGGAGGSYWVNADYEWGYVDNYSKIDMISGGGNRFRISDAVTFDGQPIKLKYIDFVKVHTAVNAKSGSLGEISTEVFNFYDYSLK